MIGSEIAAYAAAGIALSALYLGCLYGSARAFAGRGAMPAVLLFALRIVAAFAAFRLAADAGAVALLAMLAGFLSARYALQPLIGRFAPWT